jgi:hypothetical protein
VPEYFVNNPVGFKPATGFSAGGMDFYLYQMSDHVLKANTTKVDRQLF